MIGAIMLILFTLQTLTLILNAANSQYGCTQESNDCNLSTIADKMHGTMLFHHCFQSQAA